MVAINVLPVVFSCNDITLLALSGNIGALSLTSSILTVTVTELVSDGSPPSIAYTVTMYLACSSLLNSMIGYKLPLAKISNNEVSLTDRVI